MLAAASRMCFSLSASASALAPDSPLLGAWSKASDAISRGSSVEQAAGNAAHACHADRPSARTPPLPPVPPTQDRPRCRSQLLWTRASCSCSQPRARMVADGRKFASSPAQKRRAAQRTGYNGSTTSPLFLLIDHPNDRDLTYPRPHSGPQPHQNTAPRKQQH